MRLVCFLCLYISLLGAWREVFFPTFVSDATRKTFEPAMKWHQRPSLPCQRTLSGELLGEQIRNRRTRVKWNSKSTWKKVFLAAQTGCRWLDDVEATTDQICQYSSSNNQEETVFLQLHSEIRWPLYSTGANVQNTAVCLAGNSDVICTHKIIYRLWFHIFLNFHPQTWRNDPIWGAYRHILISSTSWNHN